MSTCKDINAKLVLRMPVLMLKVSQGDYLQTGAQWDSLTVEARDLIRGLLCVDVEQRLGAREALQHSWF
jgi:calcium-dependent protein kinase